MTELAGGSTKTRVDPSSPLPDHAVVPAVWGRITNLDVDRGEGSSPVTRVGTVNVVRSPAKYSASWASASSKPRPDRSPNADRSGRVQCPGK